MKKYPKTPFLSVKQAQKALLSQKSTHTAELCEGLVSLLLAYFLLFLSMDSQTMPNHCFVPKEVKNEIASLAANYESSSDSGNANTEEIFYIYRSLHPNMREGVITLSEGISHYITIANSDFAREAIVDQAISLVNSGRALNMRASHLVAQAVYELELLSGLHMTAL